MHKLVYGKDLDGNQTMISFPIDVEVPKVGTLRKDDAGNINGYWGRNAAWNSLPIIPELLDGELRVETVED